MSSRFSISFSSTLILASFFFSGDASLFNKSTYRITSIKRPGRLLNFSIFRGGGGVYSRGRLIEGAFILKILKNGRGAFIREGRLIEG